LLLIDAGTSYIKILETKTNKFKAIPLSKFNFEKIKKPKLITGHSFNFFPKVKKINELVALSEGGKKLINNKNYILLDIGSRDMKLIKNKNKQFEKCDWNTTCGAMVGFTIDLIMKYFNKKPSDLPKTKKCFDITCGLLGITNFFDLISKNTSIEEGMSALINGMARFAWNFAGRPNEIYLSGGLSENEIFLYHLKKYSKKLHPLGRYVLLNGLNEISKRT
jgi:activator of 2-hydroxyglutaryl-CoA dehydratase